MARPVFILATDLRPGEAAWASAEAQAGGLQAFAVRTLGVTPWVDLACLPARSMEDAGEHQLGRAIDRRAGDEASVIFVLPAAFDLNIWQRTMLGEELAARAAGTPASRSITIPSTRRMRCSSIVLPVRSCEHWQSGASNRGVPASSSSPTGQVDPATRADSYRLMRLLWEQADLGRGEVGFVRHSQPFLRDALDRCLAEPLNWLLLPQCQSGGRALRLRPGHVDDHQRAHPEAAVWRLLDPPRDHPAILAWLEQRLLRALARQAGSSRRGFPPPELRPRRSRQKFGPARIGCRRTKRRSGRGSDVLAGPGIPPRSPRSSRGSSSG